MGMRKGRDHRPDEKRKKRKGTGVDDVMFLDADGKPQALGFSGLVPGKILAAGDDGEPMKRPLTPAHRTVASVGDLMRLEADVHAGRFIPRPSLLIQILIQMASWHGRVRPRDKDSEVQPEKE
jgi:hypothetical protein